MLSASLNKTFPSFVTQRYDWLAWWGCIRKRGCADIMDEGRKEGNVLFNDASSHRQDNTYHWLCYTSRGALAGTRNRSTQWVHSMKDRSDDPSHHERALLPRSYISLLQGGWHEMLHLVYLTSTIETFLVPASTPRLV